MEWMNRLPLATLRTLTWLGILLIVLVKNTGWPQKNSVYPLYAQASRELWAGVPPTSPTAIQHLPWFADLLAPFAWLPDRIGATLWFATILLVFVTGIQRFARHALPPQLPHCQRLWFECLIPWIGLGSLLNNQTNTLIAGLFLWATVGMIERRWWLTSIAIALTSFKLYPVGLGLVFAARQPRELIPRMLICGLALVALPWLIHADEWVAQRHLGMWEYLRSGVHYQLYAYTSLREFGLRWFGGWPPLGYSTLQIGSFVAILVVARWCRLGIDSPKPVIDLLTLTTIWMITLGPSVEPHTFLIASVPIAWLSLRVMRERPGLTIPMVGMLSIIGILQNEVLGRTIHHAILESKIAAVVNLLFGILAIVAMMRDGQSNREQSQPRENSCQSASMRSAAMAAPDSSWMRWPSSLAR
ncbi:glycosyltransferase family 87 protein [Tuwongella immobilis]|uniref:DUF2029 domain-containing protein n=1 Tax=Tuwongella immobilis TaxID=692036 RepID=A0A6C2YS45_9BACT|nr:glycosyltransferase family 87 protein [Tuwongella immobilis]VIP04490.1 membrane protein : Uncharacterized protein OS=Planctomyces maris DSM 8797 GN=PM8797T_05860 PE=4 SV=1: DUF2029 [Tuwongella immobilis]VTS06342.1 membrane protein : Uncharacterized protein OS=Planctomyces maris DSM 8797 GN=PM8797T_05860 PE=4 SV=1: DUF2029 [Tuwongella immobilis]